MKATQYEWQYRELPPQWQEQVRTLQEAGLPYSPAFLRLCLARGLTSVEAIQQATERQPQLFHDAYLLYDMDRAVERLRLAIDQQEQIVIYGDYDADGITSTLILLETLELLGAQVAYYLPNRLVDGYGPNLARYQQLIEAGAQLILTCDNGVAGFEAIDYAMQQGVDVIVSDHHELQATLPNAYAIIHPKHPQGHYPFKELSGAGVALKIATALLEEIPTEMIELAAIGTVSDLVSLTDENRTIVMSGLQLMGETLRIGLQLLLEDAGVANKALDSETIGFVIGPRLNAIGRLGDPTPALELLRTSDEEEAAQLLELINQKNQERKQIVETIMQEVEQRLQTYDRLPDIIIEASAEWPAGVLGIVAGRLMERYHRPTLIFQYQAKEKWYRGSARSIESIHLFDWLSECREQLTQFGGHAQAAGMTVEEQKWQAFCQQLAQIASQHQPLLQQPKVLWLDLTLDVNEVTTPLIKELQLLSPFGMDNPKPMVALPKTKVKGIRAIGTHKQHIKLEIQSVVPQVDAPTLNVIGFNLAEQCQAVQVGSELAIAGELQLNEWQQKVLPQVQLKAIGLEGQVWYDWRAAKDQSTLWQVEQALYVCQSQTLKTKLQAKLLPNSYLATYSECEQLDCATWQELVILEPPVDLVQLKTLIATQSWQSVRVVSYVAESKYLAGLPTRQEFVQLYRWLATQPEFVIRERLPQLATHFGIHPTKLKMMFHVFFEAKFVTIEQGRVHYQKAPANQTIELEQTQAYRRYQSAMQAESVLLYQSLEQLKQYFTSK